jgi:hypothetical protein
MKALVTEISKLQNETMFIAMLNEDSVYWTRGIILPVC